MRDALTLALGLVTGLLSGAFGIGGAVVSTPGVRALGASALVAVGTTLPSILPGAVAGTARYQRAGLVRWPVVAVVAPVGALASVVGSLASHVVPGGGHWLMVATAALVGLTGLRLARGDDGGEPFAAVVAPPLPGEGASQAASPPPRSPPERERLRSLVLGTGAGGLSGLLGLGGGLVLLPGFVEVLRMPVREAVATSLACVGLLAVPGTVTHAFLGDIDWRLAILLAVAVVPGARLGAAASVRLSQRRLRFLVAGVLIVLAVVYGGAELRFVAGT